MIQEKFYPLTASEFEKINTLLTNAELKVYLYLMTLNPFGEVAALVQQVGRKIEVDTEYLSERLGLNRRTVQRAVKRLEELRLLTDYFKTSKINPVEYQIRDRLHQQLGGLIEVATPAGRIDLLTNTEIIEVKRIGDWKAALGQILVYSAYYPEHQKRLHLFGSAKELKKLADIEAACLEFGIQVTGEEVQS